MKNQFSPSCSQVCDRLMGGTPRKLLKNPFGTGATQPSRRPGTASEQPAGWSKRLSSAAAASGRREAYSVRYVEPPSAARTKLADPSAMLRACFFNILLGKALPKPANFTPKSRAEPNRIAPDLVEAKEGNRQSSLLRRRMPSYSLQRRESLQKLAGMQHGP